MALTRSCGFGNRVSWPQAQFEQVSKMRHLEKLRGLGVIPWHLRDKSNPDECRYYLASDDEASKFNDPAHVDKQIDTDRANMEARDRATKA